ncbi:MAG: 3-hydroxybutyryl-CoA dehydrogenase [Bacteroidetes bacterium]|jgi:3-hydroxybutyryl-CoA dehydrogenase|nr:3-hydroxybutyryl-CoA dehydrogenase [Bacteroidota bacterium]MDF2453943.1 3-hydroxybutyryl-CoA dehydrogenase [Bacteroidota bacterium]
MFTKDSIIGVVGSGAMGSGIAQVASTAGHKTIVYDTNEAALEKAKSNLQSSLNKLVEKQKITAEKAQSILSLTSYTGNIGDFKSCDLIIEAIVEKSEVKQSVFKELESITSETCVLASNTSSLSITSIASACQKPEKVVGIHFFNPATLMPLVEIIPGVATDPNIAHQCQALINSWGKVTVMAKDTPGFIVNRVARPFYSEALRIYDEQLADMATIDWAMREIGGFKMGPFELMDLIGHDVNYVVTETVWQQFYYDPRFKPSLTQKRLLEAKFLGKKSGRGFYDYREGVTVPEPKKDEALGREIVSRILCMLVNEACDTNYLGIASITDIDLAMTKGVNYPKGLLQWADEIGPDKVLAAMNALYARYEEDRYRACVLLKDMVKHGKRFY